MIYNYDLSVEQSKDQSKEQSKWLNYTNIPATEKRDAKANANLSKFLLFNNFLDK